MLFLATSPNWYRFELSKEVLYDSVGQRAAKLTVLKVWPCRESKLEFETKTLNAKHPGLGSSALQCLYWSPKSMLSWKMPYFRFIYINKNHIMKLTFYTFKVKKNIGILGYQSLGCIKLGVLELPPLKYIKSGSKKIRQVQKMAISKKFTFFVLSSWNSVKMITSWGE